MNDAEAYEWLKENNPISCEDAFEHLRGQVSRDNLRIIFKKYRNWRSQQPYESHIARSREGANGINPVAVTFDIEISPWLGWGFEAYKGNILKIEQDSKIMSFAWAYLDDEQVYGMCLADYPDYKADKFNINDEAIVKDLHDILTKADVIIGQNSNKFDIRHANARFWYYGLKPLSKKVKIDTLRVAKREFYLPKYGLNDLTRYRGLPGKTEQTYSDLVWGCLDGDREKWNALNYYCKNDVKITKETYLSERGFDSMHPNMSFFSRKERECPVCRSDDYVELDSMRPMRTGMRKNYQCKVCGKTWVGEILKDGYDTIKTY